MEVPSHIIWEEMLDMKRPREKESRLQSHSYSLHSPYATALRRYGNLFPTGEDRTSSGAKGLWRDEGHRAERRKTA